MKHVVVLADAAEDIESARDFYEAQEPGVGEYCVDSLLTDVESLARFSGIENTVRFIQEIFDSTGRLVAVHEKFPVDLGHKQL